MDPELLRERAEAYALGALDGAERDELQALLDARDPAALQEVRRATDLAGQLAWLAPPAEPPALLRPRLMNQIRSQAAPGARKPARWFAVAGWVAAAALLVVALVEQSQLARLGSERDVLVREAARNRKVLSILMARDARMIRLGTTSQEPVFRAFWSGPGGLVLAGVNVPAPASGRTFQLWIVPKQGNPISVSVFEPDASGQVVLVTDVATSPADAAALAISDEPGGGSPQPTTKPAYVGSVSE